MLIFANRAIRDHSSHSLIAARPRRCDLNSPRHAIRHMALGNQAVQQMLRSRAIQAKLVVNEPGDEYEREADRVAEQVMSMPEPVAPMQADRIHRTCPKCDEDVQRQPEEEEEEKVQAKPVAEQITPMVQRQAGAEEEEEKVQAKPDGVQRACQECEEEVQRQPDEEEEEKVQTKPIAEQITPLVQRQAGPEEEYEKLQARPDERVQCQVEPEEEEETVQKKGPGGGGVSPGLEAQIRSMRGGGQPLSPKVRSFFEPRFGHDFGQVRVHADMRAKGIVREMKAQGLTSGSDIFFSKECYSPETGAGRLLLAHELAHVVQQEKGYFGVQRWSGKEHRDLTRERIKIYNEIAFPGSKIDERALNHLIESSVQMDFRSRELWFNIRGWIINLPKRHEALVRYYRANRKSALNHGEGGLYEEAEKGKAAEKNKKYQEMYIERAKEKKGTNEALSLLGDALHIAQDRGAHGEGAKGYGHDNKSKNCDDLGDNQEGYEEARKNTREVIFDARDILYDTVLKV